MPRLCLTCRHPDRAAIDRALVAGASFHALAALHHVSEDALARHGARHLAATLVHAQHVDEVARADDLLTEVRRLHARAAALLDRAEDGGDLRTALAGVREARACLELLAKLVGQLDERPQLNVLVAPEWLAVRAALLLALGPYPDARAAVAQQLTTLEAGHDARR